MMWLIDRCQNRISADQYHMTVLSAQVSTHRGYVLKFSIDSVENLSVPTHRGTAGSLRRRPLLKNLSGELAGSHNKQTITLFN